MPHFATSNEWYEQSSLLLKARPSTARITSKYTVLKPTSAKVQKRRDYAAKRAQNPANSSTEATPTQDAEAPTATFQLKTYDPVSGTCLQYETNKAAEVGRLIATLGRLGKHMAAIEEVTTDLTVPAGSAGIETQAGTPVGEKDVVMTDAPAKVEAVPKAGGAGGAGGKKKKKGKK